MSISNNLISDFQYQDKREMVQCKKINIFSTAKLYSKGSARQDLSFICLRIKKSGRYC